MVQHHLSSLRLGCCELSLTPSTAHRSPSAPSLITPCCSQHRLRGGGAAARSCCILWHACLTTAAASRFPTVQPKAPVVPLIDVLSREVLHHADAFYDLPAAQDLQRQAPRYHVWFWGANLCRAQHMTCFVYYIVCI